MQYSHQYRRILKIILMESLRRSEDIPLFTFWERNLEFVLNTFSNRVKDKPMDEMEPLFLQTFFFTQIPAILYHIFGESWAEHFNMDKQKMDRYFSKIVADYFEKNILPRLWGL
ncbi:MAG: hypothetical protein ACOC7U_00695 [Spirochaetota bacterium]